MPSFRPPRSPDHAIPSHSLDPSALPALLRATHLLGLALGTALGRLRETGATVARMFERAEESALLLRMMREATEILAARWDKVPERQRPHYGPEQRFRILRIRTFLGLSQRETAAMFRVSVETVARWETEAMNPGAEGPRPLIAPNPPVRRFADVVRAVVKTMELAGFGGNDLIARTLARAGWKLSSRTVGRIRRERWPSPPPSEAASGVPRAVRAKRPNHVWMVDLTDVKGLFGIVTFKVAVVFDAFSRMPLSVWVFSKEASALEIARFVSKAARRHGRPAHFISDHARCFIGQIFRRRLLCLGVKQRFGAVGKKGSIALIERLGCGGR
jgi:DNA-binding transcriptional regulator YiaG